MFISTFAHLSQAQSAIDEILRGGLSADSISLICRRGEAADSPEDLRERMGRVGDATDWVGRPDDPDRPATTEGDDLTQYTTLQASPISGIDTSDSGTNVDSADQLEDSQEYVDRETYGHNISQSEHERDDLNLAVHTNFPTPVPVRDMAAEDDTELHAQMADGLDTLFVPHWGVIAGGGAMATAALDSSHDQALRDFLTDEGVPKDTAEDILRRFGDGDAVLAVEVVPGTTNEDAVEDLTTRHGGVNVGLFDAPRFYEGGGKRPQSGGGES